MSTSITHTHQSELSAKTLIEDLKQHFKHIGSVMATHRGTYIVAFDVPYQRMSDIAKEARYKANVEDMRLLMADLPVMDTLQRSRFIHAVELDYLDMYVRNRIRDFRKLNTRVIAGGLDLQTALTIPFADTPMVEIMLGAPPDQYGRGRYHNITKLPEPELEAAA